MTRCPSEKNMELVAVYISYTKDTNEDLVLIPHVPNLINKTVVQTFIRTALN